MAQKEIPEGDCLVQLPGESVAPSTWRINYRSQLGRAQFARARSNRCVQCEEVDYQGPEDLLIPRRQGVVTLPQSIDQIHLGHPAIRSKRT